RGILATVHRYAERLRHGAIGVDGEVEGQLVLFDERGVRRGILMRDAEHFHASLLEGLPIVTDTLSLDRAARCVVLRVEVDRDLLPFEARQIHRFAVLQGKGHVRRGIAGLELLRVSGGGRGLRTARSCTAWSCTARSCTARSCTAWGRGSRLPRARRSSG